MKKLLSIVLVLALLPNTVYAAEDFTPYVNWTKEIDIRDYTLSNRVKSLDSMLEQEEIMMGIAGERDQWRENGNNILTDDNDYRLHAKVLFCKYPKKPFWHKLKGEPQFLVIPGVGIKDGMAYSLTDKNNKVDRGFILKREVDDEIITRIRKEIERVGGNSTDINILDVKQRRNYKQNWSKQRHLGEMNREDKQAEYTKTLLNYMGSPIENIKNEVDKGKKVEIELDKLESRLKYEIEALKEIESPEVRNLLVVGYIDKFDSVIAIDTAHLETTEEIIVMQIRFKGNQEVMATDLNNKLYKVRIVYNY